MNAIDPKDIRAGDTVRVTWVKVIGKVHPDDPDRMPAEPEPYRMKEPHTVGAVVVDEYGHKWVCGFAPNDYMWVCHVDGGCDRWSHIINPQPFQNCVLAADDPEPPVGSVVRDLDGLISERGEDCWRVAGTGHAGGTWAGIAAWPVTLLYRGRK